MTMRTNRENLYFEQSEKFLAEILRKIENFPFSYEMAGIFCRKWFGMMIFYESVN